MLVEADGVLRLVSEALALGRVLLARSLVTEGL